MAQTATLPLKAGQRSPWRERLSENWQVFKRNPLGRIGLVLLVIFALMAAFSYVPQLIDPMYHPMTGVDPDILHTSGPSLRHWLGTDFMGRDLFSQLLAGARVAFMVGVSAAFMSIVLGVTIGMIAGYGGGVTLDQRAHAPGRYDNGHAHPFGGA